MGIRLELWKLQLPLRWTWSTMPTTKKLGAFSLADILTGQMFIYIDVQLSVVYSSGPFGFGKRTGNCVCHYDLKAEV